MSSPNKFARVSSLLGALAWCLTLPLRTGDSFETDLIQKVFLLAAFVVVPLALSFLTIKPEELSLRIALWMQPFAAVCVLVSFVLDQGPLAGVIAAVWLIAISFIALGGLLRAVFASPRQANELIIDIGLMYLPVGGAWLFASRIGYQPMDSATRSFY